MADQHVFISYAWGGESETVANEVESILRKQGINLVRDKTDLGFKGLIREFMEKIGQGNFVVLIISDKYLKSKNCMFELMEVERKGEFFDRIFPIVLPDANIYDSLGILGYLKYWDQKIKELNISAKELDNLADTRKVQEDINLYTDIRGAIDDLAGKLSNMNTLTVEIMRSKTYQPLVDALLAQSGKAVGQPQPPTASKKEGKVLYHIPGMMKVHFWTRCTVRLAWEELVLREGLQIPESEQTIESIRLGKIMQVALGEGSDRGKFEINPLSSEEQFIEEGEFTEWLFDVKPLQLGRFPLVLKISLIQVIEGKERKKDLVLERIVITETEVPKALTRFETAQAGLQALGKSILIPSQDENGLEETESDPVTIQQIPDSPVSPYVSHRQPDASPTAPFPAARTSVIRKMMPYAASVLVLITAGVLIFNGGMRSGAPEYAEYASTDSISYSIDDGMGNPIGSEYAEAISVDSAPWILENVEEESPRIVTSASPGSQKLLLTVSQNNSARTVEEMAFVITVRDFWELQELDFPLDVRAFSIPDSMAEEWNDAPVFSPTMIQDSVLKVANKNQIRTSPKLRLPDRPEAPSQESIKTLQKISPRSRVGN
jgi:hypothetical protein